MRLRNVKYAKALIDAHPNYVITKPKLHQGMWSQVFGNNHPIEVEIGCGKGKFIFESALKNPDKNFIGIEKFDSVIVRALEKIIQKPLDNLRLVRMDANQIEEVFEEGEINQLYLNFSDPWPKKRHAKRRLTSSRFLKRYQSILKEQTIIKMKTDNYPLFEYSMMMFNDHPQYDIISCVLDLYQIDLEDNIQTEFEMKFVEEGHFIHYLKIQFKGVNDEKIL
jgi:tRNA (guanine-N7-)-methyltransferase